MGLSPELEALRIPAGLCASCAYLRLVSSARSVFVRCGRADLDPAWPRYPALPQRACGGYEEKAALDLPAAP